MATTDDLGHIGFNAGRARKKAARMLALKKDYDDLTEYLKALLDREIAKELPSEISAIRDEDAAEATSKKARTARRGEKQGAR